MVKVNFIREKVHHPSVSPSHPNQESIIRPSPPRPRRILHKMPTSQSISVNSSLVLSASSIHPLHTTNLTKMPQHFDQCISIFSRTRGIIHWPLTAIACWWTLIWTWAKFPHRSINIVILSWANLGKTPLIFKDTTLKPRRKCELNRMITQINLAAIIPLVMTNFQTEQAASVSKASPDWINHSLKKYSAEWIPPPFLAEISFTLAFPIIITWQKHI